MKEHWDYGGRIHEETARALAAALSQPSTRSVGHALYLKLFAELVNATEVAGAWGWVLRTRREHPLVLDAFLTYPHHAPRVFFQAVLRNRTGSLISLLRLPAEHKVVAALDEGMPSWTEEQCRISLFEFVAVARSPAGRYFAHDEISRRAYNRVKHGATLLYDESLDPREFWVIEPHRHIESPDDRARYDLPKFKVSREMVDGALAGVATASTVIRYFAGLARVLNDAGLLYPRGRVTAQSLPR